MALSVTCRTAKLTGRVNNASLVSNWTAARVNAAAPRSSVSRVWPSFSMRSTILTGMVSTRGGTSLTACSVAPVNGMASARRSSTVTRNHGQTLSGMSICNWFAPPNCRKIGLPSATVCHVCRSREPSILTALIKPLAGVSSVMATTGSARPVSSVITVAEPASVTSKRFGAWSTAGRRVGRSMRNGTSCPVAS